MGRKYIAALGRAMRAELARVGPVGTVLGWGPVGLIILAMVWMSWTAPPPSPPTAADQQRAAADRERMATKEKKREQEYQTKRYLCRVAAVCKKYSEVRLECATAGNFKTCLRIKMGNDAEFGGVCSGYDEGGPALPLPPEAPNTVECFFHTLFE
jgi:hypothetical protein